MKMRTAVIAVATAAIVGVAAVPADAFVRGHGTKIGSSKFGTWSTTQPLVAPSLTTSSTQNNRVTMTFSSTDSGVTFQCNTDADTLGFRACTSPFQLQGNQFDGSHTYSVRTTKDSQTSPTTTKTQAA